MAQALTEKPLNSLERTQLRNAEGDIERGRKTFFEVGQALLSIRDGKLYRETHKTFEDYCRGRWDFDRTYGHRLMASAEVISRLLPIGNKIPATESQARPLTTIDLEQVGDVWQEVIERAPRGDDGEPIITAKHVKDTVDWWKSDDEPYVEEDEPEVEPDWSTRWEAARKLCGQLTRAMDDTGLMKEPFEPKKPPKTVKDAMQTIKSVIMDAK